MRAWLLAVALFGCRFGFDGNDRDASSTTDGTSIDAIGDAGTDTASSCPSFAVLCDDFESGDLTKWTTTNVSAGGSALVSTTRPRSGMFALDVTTPVGPSSSFAAAVLRRPAQSTGTLATRHYFNPTSQLGGYDLVIVFRHHQTPQYVTTGGDTMSRWVSSEADIADTLFDHFTSVATPPADVWACVELVYTFPAAGAGLIEVYVDDVLVLSTAAGDTSGAFTEIQVGIGRADSPGQRVFVDDVVIANQRIGC